MSVVHDQSRSLMLQKRIPLMLYLIPHALGGSPRWDLGRGGGGGLLGGAGCGEGKGTRRCVRRPRRLLPMARPRSAPSPLRALRQSPIPHHSLGHVAVVLPNVPRVHCLGSISPSRRRLSHRLTPFGITCGSPAGACSGPLSPSYGASKHYCIVSYHFFFAGKLRLVQQ